MQKLVAVIAAATALAAPSLARAGDVAMRVQQVPVSGRAIAAAAKPMHFNMLAVHWAGRGTVEYRVHRLHGRWAPWVAADADVAPDGGTGRWHDGNLAWTGASDDFRFRTRGGVGAVRAYELWSRVTTNPVRGVSAAGEPAIVTRAGWGADEEIVRAKPLLAAADRLAIVHHTAGTNAYTRAQAPAIVRGIEAYHVKANGWNDIGYNFLVDRFGTVYEGRGGGIDKNVVGAHAEGFNTGTFGVSLIGNYAHATPPKAQQDALVSLLAWRLDVAHVDPRSTAVYTSGGNAKYRSGRAVTLRAISGHRDTGPSECPGTGAYVILPTITRRVAAAGLPKLYSPAVAGALGGPVRFTARLSSSLPWTVTITDQLGQVVATGGGKGALVDWTWEALLARTGLFTWSIAAPGVLEATGTIGIGRPPPQRAFSLTNLLATPSAITPGADGAGGGGTVSFTLGVASTVTAAIFDGAGAQVLSLLNEVRAPGNNSFGWDASILPDGRYGLAVTATAGAKHATKSADVIVDRTLSGLEVLPHLISPNGDGVNDVAAFSFTLAQDVPLRLDIEQSSIVVGSPFSGRPGIGEHTLEWDGTAFGAPLFDGAYQAVLTVTDQLGDVRLPVPIVIDTTPPTLTVVDKGTLRFRLDEAATVSVLVNQKTRIVLGEQKGTFTFPYQGGPVTQLTAQAQDLAGNYSPAITR
ncbi:MAG: N-acetylmuramoyl-L-alanine amidase [Gaiellaceae bacterium]